MNLAVPLTAGTVSNEENDSPLNITKFTLRYGNFGGADALQLDVEQSATLMQDKYYSQGGPNAQYSPPIKVPWCNIYRQQTDVFDAALSGSQGAQFIDLVARSSDSVDKSWSEPVPDSTGNPTMDIILGILKGASDCLALFAGPVGIAMFLVKLAITTIGEEIDLTNIEAAKDRTKPMSPDSILHAIAFQWGGLGDVNYTSAKFSGGLKIIGS